MKHINLLAILVLTAMLGTFGFSCYRANWSSDDFSDRHKTHVDLAAGDVHDGWYFAAGDYVVIDGTINGDAYIAASKVSVNGKIDGDLIVAGSRVEVNGVVTEHIRAAGGNVVVNGSVGKDVTIAGGSLEIGKSAVIAGNVLAAGGDMDVNGVIGKNFKVATGNLTIAGTVNGDVDFAGGTMNANHAGAIGGKLKAYVSDSRDKVTLADSAVRGDVTIDINMKRESNNQGFWPRRIWWRVFMYATLLFTGLVMLLLCPAPFGSIGEKILKQPGHSFAYGIVTIFAVPILAVIVMITVIGIPLGLLMLLVYGVLLYLSQLTLGIALGRRLMGMEGKRGVHLFLAFFVGLTIVSALELVPYVRFILMLCGLFFGTGAIVIMLRDNWRKVRV